MIFCISSSQVSPSLFIDQLSVNSRLFRKTIIVGTLLYRQNGR